MAAGWIKLHRKLINNPVVMKDTDHLGVWIYLLTHASHAVQISIFDGKKRKIFPGELITGRSKIALALKLSESKVERIISLFKSELMIRQVSSSKSRLISILKWDDYQIIEQESERKVNNNRTASEQQPDTIKELEELKNVEKIPFREKFFKDQRYLETVMMNWKVNLTQLNQMMDAFLQQLLAEEKIHKDYASFKSHFNNWGVKRFTDYPGNENSQPVKISSFV